MNTVAANAFPAAFWRRLGRKLAARFPFAYAARLHVLAMLCAVLALAGAAAGLADVAASRPGVIALGITALAGFVWAAPMLTGATQRISPAANDETRTALLAAAFAVLALAGAVLALGLGWEPTIIFENSRGVSGKHRRPR